MFLAPCGKCC